MTADAGAFLLVGFPLPPRMHPQAGVFTLAAQSVGLGRSLTIDFNLPATLRLPRLNTNLPFVQDNGNPTLQAQQWWQGVVESIEAAYAALASAVNAIQAAYNAAAQASAAAVEANNAADAAQAAVDTVETTLDQIQSGEIALDAINVGGTRFVNSGGDLIPEP